MVHMYLTKLAVSGSIFIALLAGPTWEMANASPIQNINVGTANGPPGRTNIQTLADFENHVLHSSTNPTPEGFGFKDTDSNYQISLQNCGPGSSTKCLRIRNPNGYYKNSAAFNHSQIWWAGPRKGESAFMKETQRANSHSLWVKGFDELKGHKSEVNFDLGMYNKRRTPSIMANNNPESDNMHGYFKGHVKDWGGAHPGGVWREILVRSNPNSQRSNKFSYLGYDAFNGYSNFWQDFTRFYYVFSYNQEFNVSADVFLDNILYFYENPFMAGFPNSMVKHGVKGQTVTFDAIVWNTHPTDTRTFLIRCGGWNNSQGTSWSKYACGGISAIGNTGWFSVTGRSPLSTGKLAPGEGFVFHVTAEIPATAPTGGWGRINYSVNEDPSDVPNPQPYFESRSNVNITDSRYDLPGIGYSFKVIAATSVGIPGSPPPVTNFNVTSAGGSWADLTWVSSAKSQSTDETTNDPTTAAYAIRYSNLPITNEASWRTAVPVESVSPVFGPNIPQRYSIRGLRKNTQYYAAIRVYNENGIGSPIISRQFQTISSDIDTGSGAVGTSPPSPPHDLILSQQ